VCGLTVHAQKHTTIYTNPADTAGNGSSQRIIISYYTPANQQNLDEFQQLVSSYLNLYIDKCAVLENGDVKLKKSKKETLRDLNGIVVGALDFYDYQPLKTFKSFSKNVDEKLDAIGKLDFSRTQYTAGARDSSNVLRMEKFYLQNELDNLKELASMEVGIYGSANVLVKSSSEQTFIDAGTKQKLLDEYTSYDKNKPLQPIRVELSDASVAMISFEDSSTLGPEPDKNDPNANNEFASQVLKLLEANNTKLDGMQKQIDDLRTEQLKMWQQSQDEKSIAMQKQIDDLREMVMALVGMKTGEPVASNGGGTSLPPAAGTRPVISNMPGAVNIYFQKNSATLDANSKLALNEIVDMLARDPDVNIIITGFADKTGDAKTNLVLSQMRSKAVKNFITQSGLAASRLITNYYGDTESKSENSSDRKVRVNFVRRG
jgi:outer membrane protein OmpA-like peptidoglycan-associated protein